jgi:pyridoxine 5-phosphate synthase
MRALVVSLDAAAAMRDAGGREEPRLAVAAMAAELAGADAVRLGVNEGLRPVRESDLHDVRRTARELELRLAPAPSLLKLVLEVRPDRVLLAAEPLRGAFEGGALDPGVLRGPVTAAVRALREAGIPAWVRLAPDLEAVKAARGAEAAGVELHTGTLVDLPEGERAPALERLGDAARLAAKLRLPVRAGGGLDGRRLRAVLAAAPVLEGVAVGRELAARALLVGVDRAVRDLRAELA